MHSIPIHRDVERLFEEERNPEENLLWSGAPLPGRFARKSLPIVLFGIPWTLFAIFWICAASGFSIPDFDKGWDLFPLFGVPFVLVGFGMLSSPWWMRKKALKTAYYVTNRRALIIERALFRGFKIRSFYPNDLKTLERVQSSDGYGDIIMDRLFQSDGEGGRNVTEIGFFGIPNVRDVERNLRQLAE